MINWICSRFPEKGDLVPILLAFFPVLQIVKFEKVSVVSLVFIGLCGHAIVKRNIVLSAAFVGLVLWVLVGLFWVSDYSSWLVYVYHAAYGISFVVLVSNLNSQSFRKFLQTVLRLNVVFMLFGLLEIYFNVHIPLSSIYEISYSDILTEYFIRTTPSAGFFNPNDYGFYLVVSSWLLMEVSQGYFEKAAYYFLLVINLLFISSRAALTALIFLLVAELLRSKTLFRRIVASIGVVLYLSLLINPLMIEGLGRYRQIKLMRSTGAIVYFLSRNGLEIDAEFLSKFDLDTSSEVRSELSAMAWKLFQHHSFAGVGFGQTDKNGSLHNIWLEALCDLGLLGIVLVLWFGWGRLALFFRSVPVGIGLLYLVSGGIACLAPSSAISRAGFWLFIAGVVVRLGLDHGELQSRSRTS